jgi:pyridoxamine 5'-phosphate oxidase
MTIWWDHVGYQIRVVGTAEVITDVEADVFWQTRSRSAQLTTPAFDQSELLVAEDDLTTGLQEASAGFAE